MYQRDWRRAGEATYDSLSRQTYAATDIDLGIFAMRMHARATGGYERARLALVDLSRIRQEPSGDLALPDRPDLGLDGGAALALADVLIAMGREKEGRQLLGVILQHLRRQIGEKGRAEIWYDITYPAALALNQERDAAIAMLERSMASGHAMSDGWYRLELDPALDRLRGDPRFQRMLRDLRAHSAEQRRGARPRARRGTRSEP